MVHVYVYFIYMLLLQKTGKHVLIPRLHIYIFYVLLYKTVGRVAQSV